MNWVRVISICLVLLVASAVANATPRKVEWHNDCDANVRLAITYKNAQGWETDWWWDPIPGEVSILTDDDDIPITTSNQAFAYYAESIGTHPTLRWRDRGGRRVYTVNGRRLEFKKMNFSKKDGNFTFRTRCDDYSEEALRTTVETRSNNRWTKTQIIYEDFMYAYVPAWYLSASQ